MTSQHEERILWMAARLKQIPFVTTTPAAAATTSSLADAVGAYNELSVSDNNVVPKFQSIVHNLSPFDLEFLADYLEGKYYKMLAEPMVVPSGQKVKGAGPGGGFLMQVAAQAIGGVFAKVVVDEAVTALNAAPACSEPFEKASAVVGLLLLMAGVALHDKKPSLAKIMVKFGGVAIAFAILHPMAASLPPPTACLFGVLAAAVVVVTAILA